MKIKIGFGGILFLLCGLFSQDVKIFAIYASSAIFHEMGHILAAKMLGIELEKITLEVTGARIYPRRCFSSYREEWILSAAGPVANLIAFAAAFVILGENSRCILQNSFALLSGEEFGFVEVMSLFALFSCLQAFLNLLPVSSFDGGRMLSCAFARLFNDKAAVRAKAILSGMFAILLWMVAVYFLLKTGAGLSLFCFSAGILFSITQEE